MKPLFFALIAAAGLLTPALAQKPANPFLGRWDITVTAPNATYPDWMEITEKDGGMDAFIQPRGGSAFHTNQTKLEGSHLVLTLSRHNARKNTTNTTIWDLTAEGDHFTGTQKQGKNTAKLEGVRAPALNRPMPKAWSKPERIFNGKDLTGWEPASAAPNHWVVQNGDLINESKGANLRTTRTFNDFKLHIEFNCPEGGNSGVYLRGRYEMQVEYEPLNFNDEYHRIGAIYSFLKPAVELPRKPGTWESFDATLVGRRLTLYRDGVKTIDNQEIPGPTGGAMDSHESEPGPILIQGDHTGGMKYRNITIALPK
jgi:hypothetical protein